MKFSEAVDNSKEVPSIGPVLRWAGSKRQLVSKILELAPIKFDRYIEPFCGSACVYFAVKPSSAILGDINSELINFYLQSRRLPGFIYDKAREMGVKKNSYYRIRSINPDDLTKVERAARFFYLNRNCLNGVYRTNASGQFNVPMGTKVGLFPAREIFIESMRALRGNVEFHNGGFEGLMSRAKSGDFYYLDPPYVSNGVRYRGEYGVGSFRCDDVPDMFSSLLDASNAGASILLSYAYNESIIRKFRGVGWNCRVIKVRRFVSGFSQFRHEAREVLIRNFK